MRPGGLQKPRPRRVLIVEDEMLIAVMIADGLKNLGYQVVGPASRIERALRLIESEEIDLALLDINVAGEKVDRVAERLKNRGIPFMFVSGYAPSWIAEAYADRPRLAKPFRAQDLERVLGDVFGPAPQQTDVPAPQPPSGGRQTPGLPDGRKLGTHPVGQSFTNEATDG